MSKWVVAFVVVAAASCTQSNSVFCEGGRVCPAGTSCSPDGTKCVTPEQLAACEDQDDGAACSYAGVDDGVCTMGICERVQPAR